MVSDGKIGKENFLNKFENVLKSKKLLKNGQKIMIGLSGGVDSVALFIALWHMRSRLGIHLLAVHVNHQLRGEESDKDEESVKDLCRKFAVSLIVKSIDIPKKGNLENNARNLRFECFRNLKKLYGMDKIALAHHKGDQAETVLLRMFRGSGISGMKGILPVSGDVIHPFLDYSKQELIDFVKDSGVVWREDKSNLDFKYGRNKIRHELLPYISENFNKNIIDGLCRSAVIFAETDEIMKETAKRHLLKIRSDKDEGLYRLASAKMLKLKSVIRFYVYRMIFCDLTGNDKNFYSSHFHEIEKLYHSEGSKQLKLCDDVIVLKEYDDIVFAAGDYFSQFQPEDPKIIKNIKSRFVFEDFRIIMKRVKKLPSQAKLREEKFTAYFDYDKIKYPLTFRHRKKGDRFTPCGSNYRKKLKDFFIDEKISKFERDKIIIIEDYDHIIWIAGYRTDQRKIYRNNGKNFLKIKIEPIQHRARSAERKKN